MFGESSNPVAFDSSIREEQMKKMGKKKRLGAAAIIMVTILVAIVFYDSTTRSCILVDKDKPALTFSVDVEVSSSETEWSLWIPDKGYFELAFYENDEIDWIGEPETPFSIAIESENGFYLNGTGDISFTSRIEIVNDTRLFGDRGFEIFAPEVDDLFLRFGTDYQIIKTGEYCTDLGFVSRTEFHFELGTLQTPCVYNFSNQLTHMEDWTCESAVPFNPSYHYDLMIARSNGFQTSID
jgi:hypothetical protein